MNKLTKIIVTFFGSGLSRVCPGTIGSILTLPLWFLIISVMLYLKLLQPVVFISIISIIILALFFIGLYFTKLYIEETKKEDPSEVVIDEVVGQLISFVLSLSFIFVIKDAVLFNNFVTEHKIFLLFYCFIMPIIFFRIYDIKKPWIIGTIDSKIKNALGVMLDDVVGGIFAGITNSLIMITILKLFVF